MDSYIERLCQLREEKKWSLENVAAALAIPAPLLTLIELGEVVPTDEQYDRIVAYVVEQT